ncbi:MAG: hypothetical protein WC269_04340 [Candidatus Gracilibacteria bacterium]|jgi:thiol-disulfide isomerase/thioredoxin
MNIFKKLFLGIVLSIAFTGVATASASTDTVLPQTPLNLYFFWGDGCPHCAKEEIFLKELEGKYPEISIERYEIYKHPENIDLLKKVAAALNVKAGGIPFTVIGDKEFIGFSEEATPKELENRVKECLENICPNTTGQIIKNASSSNDDSSEKPSDTGKVSTINIPVLGEIDPLTFSLPVLTIVIGILDGFNPCAMWTLLFLISMLLGMKNKRRMWTLGSAFIIASAFVYFLFMAAWLNLILFLGFIIWIRIGIGAVALLGGGYSLKEYFTNKDAVCKVGNNEERKKTFEKIKTIIHEHSYLLALGGIILLAFAVNLVELICSAGFPAVYTQVLTLNDLPKWQYYSYPLLYIFFFMIDDLFVFFIAMITLKVAGATTKYTRASRLIGGILMVAIGLLLIFKPEILMFG